MRRRAGAPLGCFFAADNARYSTSCSSVDFPEPETPVIATSILSGISRSISFRLWARAPKIFDLLRPGLATSAWNLDPQLFREIASGKRSRHLLDLIVGSGRDHLAAIFSGARSKVENRVGSLHDIAIVFDHQNRIAQVAQIVQDLDQAMRVAAMQSDRWLVEHIKRSYQTRAQRSRQLNALRFTAR